MEKNEFQSAPAPLQSEITKHIEALKEEDSAIWNVARNALASIGKPAIASLISGLRSNNRHVRYGSASLLGQMGDATAVEPLILALKDESPNQRGLAAHALGQLKDTRAIEPLLDLMIEDEDRINRTMAWEALISIGKAEIEPLIQILHTDTHQRRLMIVIRILADLQDVRAVVPLIEALDAADPQIRASSVQALSEIGDRRAIPHFTRLLKDQHKKVRVRASEALAAAGVKKRSWWQLFVS